MTISDMPERPQVPGDNDKEYGTSPQPPRDHDQEYSYATSEDNPHIIHTYLAPGDTNKVTIGQDIDPRYEMTIPDMRERAQVTGENDHKYGPPSESPINQDLEYNYATPGDSSSNVHTYLNSGDMSEVKQGYEFPSKISCDQMIEHIYATPEGDKSYQNLKGANIGRLYQNLRAEKL